MGDNLRDQLLGLGFKPAPAPEKPRRAPAPARDAGSRDARPPRREQSPADPARRHAPGEARPPRGTPPPQRPQSRKGPPQGPRPARTREDIDLAKAYAIRAQREKDERIEAERQKQEQARQRRESKAALAVLVKDRALNDPDADIARHFEYGGKIKRVHVNAEQLARINRGELGVLQLDGRYLVVEAALLEEAVRLFPPALALKVDPAAPVADDPYADPRYQVPDDLVW